MHFAHVASKYENLNTAIRQLLRDAEATAKTGREPRFPRRGDGATRAKQDPQHHIGEIKSGRLTHYTDPGAAGELLYHEMRILETTGDLTRTYRLYSPS